MMKIASYSSSFAKYQFLLSPMVMTKVVLNLLEHLAEKLFHVTFDIVIPCVGNDLVIQNIYLKGLSVDCTIHLLDLWLLLYCFFFRLEMVNG